MSETRTLKVIVVGNSKQAQAALKQLSGAAESTDKRVTGAGSRIGATFAKVGATAAVGFAAATVAAGAFIYKVGAPYEQTLNRIGALNKMSASEVSNLASQIEGMSPIYTRMGIDAAGASDAVLELNKAGLSVKQSMHALQGTLVLAKAGMLETGDAASLISNTLNTFHLKAGQAAHVANSLANAANASSADVSDLQEALQQVGLVANTAGLSIDETNTYLAALANNGMKGSDAGTSLKTMLLRLTSGMPTVAKGLKSIGVSVYDASGRMRDMTQVIPEIAKKLDGLNDKDRGKALYRIFGSDATRAATALFSTGSKGLDDLTKKIHEAGTAQRFAESSTQGFSGQIQILKANIKTLGEEAYRSLSPMATSLLKPLNHAFTELPNVAAKAKPMLAKAFAGFASGGGGDALGKVFGSLKKFGEAMLPTLKQLGNEFMAHLGPALKSIGQLLSGTLVPAFQQFLPVITPVVQFLLKMVGGALIGVFDGAVKVIKGAINIIAGLMNVITGLLHGNFGQVWEGIKQIFKGAFQAIIGLFQVWWNAGILSIFKRGVLSLLGAGKGLWTGLRGLFTSGIRSVELLMAKVAKFLVAPFRESFALARDFVKTGWAYIRGSFSGGVGGVRAIVGRIIEVWTYPYRQVFALVRGVVSSGWAAVRGFFSGGVSAVAGRMAALPGKILGALGDGLSLLKQYGKNVVQGLVNGIKEVASAPVDAIKSVGKGIASGFAHGLGIKSPSRVMKNLSKWIIHGITEGLKDATAVANLDKTLKSLRDKIMGAFKRGNISKGAKDDLLGILKGESAKVRTVVAARIALANQLQGAQDVLDAKTQALTDLQDKQKNLIDSTKSAVADYGSLLGMISGDTDADNSASAILARFKNTLANIKSFKGNWEKLQANGLSQSLLEQIAAAGPDQGGAIAAAFVNASSSELSDFNAVQSEIDATGSAFATETGGLYTAQINAAQSDVNGAQQTVNNISVQIAGNVITEKNLADAIAKQVRDAIDRDDKRNGRKK